MLPAIPNLNQFVWDIPDTLVPEDPLLEPQEGRYIPIRMLNDDLLIDVFSFITDPKDICALERVCKRFHYLSRTQDSLWKQRFARLWPKIVMLPPTNTCFEAQFKILHFELCRLPIEVNGIQTEKQLRDKIREMRGPNGNDGTLNQRWLAYHAADKMVDRSAIFFLSSRKTKLVSESVGIKYNAATEQLVNELRFLHDNVGDKYDGTDKSLRGGRLAALLKRKQLLREGYDATTEFTRIIEFYKMRFKGFQILFLQNFHFKSMCQNRLSQLTRAARERMLIESTQKDHLDGRECQEYKKTMEHWLSIFRIHQWLPINGEEQIMTSHLIGNESLVSFFENCSCCRAVYRRYVNQ